MNTQAAEGCSMGRDWGAIYSLKRGAEQPSGYRNTEEGRKGVPARLSSSLWPHAFPQALYTWGLRQLWSKVDPLKQLGAQV